MNGRKDMGDITGSVISSRVTWKTLVVRFLAGAGVAAFTALLALALIGGCGEP